LNGVDFFQQEKFLFHSTPIDARGTSTHNALSQSSKEFSQQRAETPRLPSGGAYGKTGEYMAKVRRSFHAR
jgi:hypothetical protein